MNNFFMNSTSANNTKNHQKASNTLEFIIQIFGFDLQIWRKAPTSRPRIICIIVALVITGIISGISFGYAINSFTNNLVLSYYLSLLWALAIINLDKMLLTSIGHKEAISIAEKCIVFIKKTILMAIRLALSTFLALVITVPLECFIFRQDIDEQFARDLADIEKNLAQNLQSGQIKELKQEKEKLELELKDQQNRVDMANKEFIGEINAQAGSGIPGYGEIAKHKESIANIEKETLKDDQQRNRSRITKLEADIDNLEQTASLEATKIKSAKKTNKGIIAQIEALSKLRNQYESVKYASYFITILFVLVEVSAILFGKILADSSAYDVLLAKKEEQEKNKTI